MKVLHTAEFYSPSVGGSQEVVKQLSEHLVALGHDVTVATTKLPNRKTKIINGVKIVEFDITGNAVVGYQGKDVKKYQRFLTNGKFDVMMNYAAQQWATDLAFEIIEHIQARKIFVPCGFSGLYDLAYSNYFKQIPTILKKYDNTVYLSNNYRDINFAKRNKINNRIIIPNGADEREFDKLILFNKSNLLTKYGIPEKNTIILTVGTHTGKKGHQESMMSFIKTRVKNSSLVIVGNTLENSGCYRKCIRTAKLFNLMFKLLNNGKSIHLLNLNREDTIKFFQASDLFIFLSNIECSPLVLFESAASGLPFLTVDVGNSKEILKWTKSGALIPSTKSRDGLTKVEYDTSAKLIESLLTNKARLVKYSKIGRQIWKQRFTWQRITEKYEKLYKGIL